MKQTAKTLLPATTATERKQSTGSKGKLEPLVAALTKMDVLGL